MAVDFTPEQIAAQFDDITRDAGPVECQCDQHPSRPCRTPAVVIVECHLLGNCNGPEANEDGNRVELLCMACARHLWREAELTASRLRAAAARAGGHPLCPTCMAPMSNPSDLMRSLRVIPGGIQ